MTKTQTIESKHCQCLPLATQFQKIAQECKHLIYSGTITTTNDVTIVQVINQNHVLLDVHKPQFFGNRNPDVENVKHTPITRGSLHLRQCK